MADLGWLDNFEARQSNDEVKRDLELTCTRCDTVVCDIEPDDTLLVLVNTVGGHACPPHPGLEADMRVIRKYNDDEEG